MKQKTLSSFFTDCSGSKRKCLDSNRASYQTVENSKFGVCPMCQSTFPVHVLISHAGVCDGVAASNLLSEKVKREHSSPARDAADDDLARNQSVSTKNGSNIETPWWTKPTPQQRLLTIENPISPSSEPIPGLYLYREFVSKEDEQQILSELDGIAHPDAFLPWKFSRFNGRHRGKRWGVHCNLRDRRVGPATDPLPPFFFNIILPKLIRVATMANCTPNEANAIDYNRTNGDYLEDHVDDRQLSKEPIANLSIGGDCYMSFINQKKKFGSVEPLRVLLPRRTLQVLTGNARYDYSHGIRNQDLVDDRRVSVTMRESPLSKTI